MGDADAPQKATAACPPRHLCLLQNIKMNVAGSLVRRGLDAHAEHGDKIKIPTWGAVMLISTFIAFLFAMFMIEYTFGRLVPTLVMIESPQDTISFEPPPNRRSRLYHQQRPRTAFEATAYHFEYSPNRQTSWWIQFSIPWLEHLHCQHTCRTMDCRNSFRSAHHQPHPKRF